MRLDSRFWPCASCRNPLATLKLDSCVQIENDRLYNIIQLTSKNQNADSRSLGADGASAETELPARQKGLNGINSAELIRKLESNQSRLQEDMCKLSRDAANLQSLNTGTTARCGMQGC